MNNKTIPIYSDNAEIVVNRHKKLQMPYLSGVPPLYPTHILKAVSGGESAR